MYKINKVTLAITLWTPVLAANEYVSFIVETSMLKSLNV